MLAHLIDAESIDFGRSIKGYNWKLEECCERTVISLMQKLSVSELLARILCNRGVSSVEEAELFLDPKLKNLMVDPFKLKGMNEAVKRIIHALENKQKICVFGDYDVDGATSTSILRRFFEDIGHNIEVYIPNRMREGYGPSVEALDKLHQEGVQLVITVDCGTASVEPLQYAKSINLDVIVIDHHLGSDILPEAVAIINPNRYDEDFGFKPMAAVGVAFLTLVALRSTLREAGWFAKNNIKEPDLLNSLDLVALGTVCDVMPLIGLNRAFVEQGLKIMAKRSNVGIATLANVAKLDNIPKVHHLGYVFGPRINAGGRVGEGILGSNLLTTNSPQEALDIALQLEALNDERRSIEVQALEDAIKQIEVGELFKKSIMFVQSNDWHIGILGILASKLKEKYIKPCAVMVVREGMAKGSARSIAGLDLGTALGQAKAEGILLEGGGHAMAGGFTVEVDKIDNFKNYMFTKFLVSSDAFDKARDLKIDAVIAIDAINPNLILSIAKGAPYGHGNMLPRFMLQNVLISNALVVGGDHIMLIASGRGSSGAIKTQKCMLFKGMLTDAGQYLLKNIGKKVHLAGSVQANTFDSEKVDFIIEDVAIPA